jgi:hypothetical protein
VLPEFASSRVFRRSFSISSALMMLKSAVLRPSAPFGRPGLPSAKGRPRVFPAFFRGSVTPRVPRQKSPSAQSRHGRSDRKLLAPLKADSPVGADSCQAACAPAREISPARLSWHPLFAPAPALTGASPRPTSASCCWPHDFMHQRHLALCFAIDNVISNTRHYRLHDAGVIQHGQQPWIR